MSVLVRRLDSSDELAVNALNRLLPQLSGGADPLDVSTLQRILDHEGNALFVAERDEEIVGTLTLVLVHTPTGVRAWIEDVIVDENSRGLGIARELLDAGIEYARTSGAGKIDLTSKPSRTSANGLYQRAGFKLRETNVYRFFLEDR